MEAGAGRIYWIDAAEKAIRSARLDGSDMEVLVSGLQCPSGIAVDAAKGELYWSDLADRKIRRVYLDGSNPQEVVEGLAAPSGTSLALDEERLLWADLSLRQILCAKRDGSSKTPQVLVSDLSKPNAVAVDAFSRKVYWGDFGTRKVHRACSDGTQSEVVVPYGKNSTSMVVDSVRSKLFWTNFGTHAIYRCDLDGRDMQPVITGLEGPSAVALAPRAGRLYWVERTAGRIRRACVDGSLVEDSAEKNEDAWIAVKKRMSKDVLCNLGDPWALALGPESQGSALCRSPKRAETAGDVQEVSAVSIEKYSWTDEGSAVKVYVSESSSPAAVAAAGDGRRPDALKADFQTRSFLLTVTGTDGSKFELRVRGLMEDIIPDRCKVRVSQGKRITITLAKKDYKTWSVLSQRNWVAIHVSAQSKPKDQQEAIASAMAALSNFDQISVVWSNFYSKAEVSSELLSQRPLVMDPTNPTFNVAHPEVFDCSQLVSLARSSRIQA
ncbi:Low-density lipoprotein receptor-related protein 6 [Symbiodinium microadriaticum]|uniref:Low-density lipoprotein receptor-related protein 6 n=1 Tax=Symbiodinium microadriaticum TaxID=2951 RepID=A0A1Q9ECW5_SYMMI|nr:Low-density lipoprotein receptor-related protein 6 [Symbiodinium microadriaticum]